MIIQRTEKTDALPTAEFLTDTLITKY